MFSFRDHLVTVTPEQGPFANQGYRLLSGNKFSVDPGAKVKVVPGFSELPFDIVRQGAEPKISLEGMDAVEVNAVRERVQGIGGARYTISIVGSRPGVPQFRIRAIHCEWSGGGGYDGDDNGSISKIESMMLDLHFNGKSVFLRRHAR